MSLMPRTVSGWLAVFFAINGFLFVVFTVLFGGGAYPWGEIRGAHYFVVTGTSEIQVSRLWFWTTYWHGLLVWSGSACYGLYLVLFGDIPEFRDSGWRNFFGKLLISVFVLLWLFLSIIGALSIVT